MRDKSWIPNWRNAAEYPDSETTSLYQWTWEFLRRNHDYQNICDDMWKAHFRPPPDVVLEKFSMGISGSFPHYRDNNPTDCEYCDDKYAKGYSYHPIMFKGRGGSIFTPAKKEADCDEDVDILEMQIHTKNENIVAIIIDLSLPINAQLSEIKKRLLGMQKRKRLVNKRIQRDKFQIYLRTLDALETGANKADIANQLFPDIDNSYPEYPGTERLNDTIQAATRYRDFDYLIIARAISEKWPPVSFRSDSKPPGK